MKSDYKHAEDCTLYVKVKDSDNFYRMSGIQLTGLSEYTAKNLALALNEIGKIINKDCDEHSPLFCGWITVGHYLMIDKNSETENGNN